MQATLLYASGNILAEGPHWHTGRKSFFWIDIDGCSIHEMKLNTGRVNRWQLEHRVSVVFETHQPDQLLLGLQGGIASYDLETEQLEWKLPLEADIQNNRTNDGACDPQGRIWVGTMDRQCSPGKGSLYCIDENFNAVKKLDTISVSNGIAWSADGSRMYYTDSPTQEIQSFVFDVDTASIRFEKIAIRVDKEQGSPDGICMDEEGMLWVAQWNGFGVYRWNPLTGKLLDKIELPVPQVSSCAFGGENMDQLLITTARENMSEADQAKYPLSGNVFIAQPGVKGISVHKFGK